MCGIVGYNGARPVTDFLLVLSNCWNIVVTIVPVLQRSMLRQDGRSCVNVPAALLICAKYVRMTRNRLLVELVIHAGQRMVVSVTRMRTHIVRVMCF